MRVIITGGTGLIGKGLAVELLAAGHQVTVLSRKPDRATGMPREVQLAAWDGRTANGWGELANGAGAIVNLAGAPVAGDNLLQMRWTAERKRRIRASRVAAGQAVVEAVRAVAVKPRVVVQASAIGYYGPRGAELIDEAAPAGGDFLSQVCMDWEATTALVEAIGVRRVVVRIGIVLSEVGGALPRQKLPFQIFAGGPVGNGKQGYSWIHLADVVGALRFLIEQPEARGAYNLTAPTPVSNAEFGRVLGRVLRRPSWLPTPGLAFRLLFGEAATILVDGQFVQPQRLQAAGYAFKYAELEPALRSLDN